MEYYAALNGKKVFVRITTWMYLKNTLLSEGSWITKGHILCDSNYIKCPEWANPQKHEVDELPRVRKEAMENNGQ